MQVNLGDDTAMQVNPGNDTAMQVNLGDGTAMKVHRFPNLNLNLTWGQVPVDGLSLTTMHTSFV